MFVYPSLPSDPVTNMHFHTTIASFAALILPSHSLTPLTCQSLCDSVSSCANNPNAQGSYCKDNNTCFGLYNKGTSLCFFPNDPTCPQTNPVNWPTRTCESECLAVPGCLSSGKGSYCKTGNNPQTCFGLYYTNSLKTDICFANDSGCPNNLPVLCSDII